MIDDVRKVFRLPAGGPDGNERMTSTVGLVLVVLLVVEAATTLSLSSLLPVHLFLGLLLLPPIVLKLATTGWRFVRYYTGRKPYRLKGPPELLLRLLAPALVASTVLLFSTGVAFLYVVAGALAAGVAVGLGTYSVQTSWLSSRHRHHHEHGFRKGDQ